jgi:hypothetical protein
MFAKRGSAHFAQRSYADTKVTRLPGRDPASHAVKQTNKLRISSADPTGQSRLAHRATHAIRRSD